jgi:hypothetical protein
MTLENSLQLASEAVKEAQRNVIQAQELVHRYQEKIQCLEEEHVDDFRKNNTTTSSCYYFIQQLQQAQILLKESETSLTLRENGLKEREQHIRFMKKTNDGKDHDAYDNHTNHDEMSYPDRVLAIAQRDFDHARHFLIHKIDSMVTTIEHQSDRYLDQLNRMKTEIQHFIFVTATSSSSSSSANNSNNNNSNTLFLSYHHPIIHHHHTQSCWYSEPLVQ